MSHTATWHEFTKRREGMCYALEGGAWLHRHVHRGEPMAHLVSSDRTLLLDIGQQLGLRSEWLQFKPLRHPEDGKRVDAWHWDLRGDFLLLGIERAGVRLSASDLACHRG